MRVVVSYGGGVQAAEIQSDSKDTIVDEGHDGDGDNVWEFGMAMVFCTVVIGIVVLSPQYCREPVRHALVSYLAHGRLHTDSSVISRITMDSLLGIYCLY